MQEIWKDVPGYEGMYQVSNFGNVLSTNCRGKGKRIKKYFINKTGYCRLLLKRKNSFVHRLVAQAFIPNPENKPHVNHKNGIKHDNRVENLEWCTRSENMKHAHNIGLQISKKGSSHPFYGKYGANSKTAKKVNQYTLEGVFIKEWGAIIEVEKAISVSPTNISQCCNGKQKTAGGFIWKFK